MVGGWKYRFLWRGWKQGFSFPVIIGKYKHILSYGFSKIKAYPLGIDRE